MLRGGSPGFRSTAVQFTCAKIGMVGGKGLAGILRQHYSRKLFYPAVLGLVIANTINATADIGPLPPG
jgi:Mn2+/Fe2+ NRAMP family transporter